jgi:hypothetical protein
MSAKIVAIVDGQRCEHELYDAEPSLDLLKILYPAARIILHDLKRDQWIVVTGDCLASFPTFGSWPR